MRVEPNQVYIIPRDTTMTIAGGELKLKPRGDARGPHLPVDAFFRSLAEDRLSGAIGVILSGTGSDGTLGLEDIKAAGGITLAQDEESAKFAGMPQSAIRSGCIDVVSTPEGIAEEIVRIGRHPYVATPSAVEQAPPVDDEEGFRKILMLLPGPPLELKPIFENECLPRLREALPQRFIAMRTLKAAMIGESACDARIAPIYKHYPDIETTILANGGDIQLNLICEKPALDIAQARGIPFESVNASPGLGEHFAGR